MQHISPKQRQQMRIKTILNQCYKFKSFVYDKVRFVREKGETFLEVVVVPRQNSQAICSRCARPATLYDRLDKRRFEFIPLWGYRVFLLYPMRRVQCQDCGVRVELIPWARGKHELTDTYRQFLAHWAKKLSWQEVAVSFRTSWDEVFQAVEFIVQWGLDHRDLSGITAIGVDEIAWRKGHQYLTLVYQIDAGCPRLLWVGKDRTVKTLLRFFRFFGEHRQMQKDGHEPVLKHLRWLLLKRRENLSQKQEVKIRDLLKYNLKSVRAYLLKEDFNGFWEYVSPAWAGKFLGRWCTRVIRSKIDPMKKVAKTLRAHKPLILNWFKEKKAFSSGIVEGLKNKAKVTTRKSYGFRTYRGAKIALYHALGKLPTPPMIHRFC